MTLARLCCRPRKRICAARELSVLCDSCFVKRQYRCCRKYLALKDWRRLRLLSCDYNIIKHLANNAIKVVPARQRAPNGTLHLIKGFQNASMSSHDSALCLFVVGFGGEILFRHRPDRDGIKLDAVVRLRFPFVVISDQWLSRHRQAVSLPNLIWELHFKCRVFPLQKLAFEVVLEKTQSMKKNFFYIYCGLLNFL